MNIETIPVIIQVQDHEEDDADLNIVVDGLELCQIRLEKGKDKGLHDACSFDLPKDASELTLQGTFSKPYEKNRSRRQHEHVRQQFKIVDIAPMTHHLRDTSRPFGRRIRDFHEAIVDFEQQYPIVDDEGIDFPLRLGEPTFADVVEVVEQRLGFNLPAGHVSLLLETGQFYIGDSYIESAKRLNNAHDYMIDPWGWGEPRESMERPPSDVIAWLKSSVILYTEVSDGLAGLLYQPKGPANCNSKEAYYWIHDDDMVNPLLLKNRDGSCKNYTDAMIWLLAQQFFASNYEYFYYAYYTDGSPNHVVLVDSSAPNSLRLSLVPPRCEEDAFQFGLYLDWEEFE